MIWPLLRNDKTKLVLDVVANAVPTKSMTGRTSRSFAANGAPQPARLNHARIERFSRTHRNEILDAHLVADFDETERANGTRLSIDDLPSADAYIVDYWAD